MPFTSKAANIDRRESVKLIFRIAPESEKTTQHTDAIVAADVNEGSIEMTHSEVYLTITWCEAIGGTQRQV